MLALEQLQIRNPVLPFPVRAEIEGFTLINYEIEPRRVAPWTPMPLSTRVVAGREVAYLTIFLGHLKLKRIGAMPALPVSFNQLNYRTYVRQSGGHALYIFRSIVSNDLVARGIKLFPHLPGEKLPFAFVVDRSRSRVRSVEAIVGNQGAELRASIEADADIPRTPGFPTLADATAFLANVPDAFYPVDECTLGRMVSFHPPIGPQGGTLANARFGWLERQEIVPIGGFNRPQSIMLQSVAPFPVYL